MGMMTATRPIELLPNHILQQRYQIVRRIGQGGMGHVFEAIDTRLGSVVAIKQTQVGMDDSSESAPIRRAFEREARILAGLRHPALPAVSDFFSQDGVQYLVMQYIPGDDLWTLLQQRGAPFPVANVVEWADQLLNVLDFLHTHQPPILHRDIKPQNMKLTPRGEIILLDFGLARGTIASHALMTTGGNLLAYTPQYAPMEQIRSTNIDERSDLYALAATLHHLLTGALPAGAIDRAAAAMEGRSDPLLPATFINPQVPVELSELLMKAMSPRPEDRPVNAAAMRAALRQVVARYRQTTPSQIQFPRTSPLNSAAPRTAPRPVRATTPIPSTPFAEIPSVKETLQQAGGTLWQILQSLWAAAPGWIKSPAAFGVLAISIGLLIGLLVAIPRSTEASRSSLGVSMPALTATPIDPAKRQAYQQAIDRLNQAIGEQPQNAQHYLDRAEAYLSLGLSDQALNDYNQAARLNPQDTQAPLGQAQIYSKQGQFDLAIAAYAKALAINEELPQARFGIGDARLALKDYVKAIDEYSRGLAIEPANVAARIGRGEAYLALRQYERAQSDFDQALALDADNPAALLQRGRSFFYQRDYSSAIADFDRHLQIMPQSSAGLYNRGLARSAAGDQAGAIADFDAYVAMHANDAEVYLYRAMAHNRLGNRSQAQADLQRCIELAGDSPIGNEAQQLARSLESK
ncbi:MAG: hypothetical protein Fur005_13690 [Roseiflexaceae bacterium]